MRSQGQNEGNCSLLGVRPHYIESRLFICSLSLPSHFQSRYLKRVRIEQSKCECLCLCLFIYCNFWTSGPVLSKFHEEITVPSLCPLLCPSSSMWDAWEEEVVMSSMRERVCVPILERECFRCQKNFSQFFSFSHYANPPKAQKQEQRLLWLWRCQLQSAA